MNLFFLLLVARHYLSKEQIRESIADYRSSSDGAFERKFERDKEELREIGIEIETGRKDAYFGDDLGYRIRRDEAELPDLTLTREEAAVMGLAARVWDHAGLAAESATAIVKLKSIGVDIDTAALSMAEPRLSAHEPSFEAMLDAATRHIEVEFEYQRPGQPASTRRLQPWGILSWRDRWYVGGYDLDREASRLFRLSRVRSDVRSVRGPNAYEIPPGVDLRDLAAAMFPTTTPRTATLEIRKGRAQVLRRMAQKVMDASLDTDEVQIAFHSLDDFAAELASFGPEVLVKAPEELRKAVIVHLQLIEGRESP